VGTNCINYIDCAGFRLGPDILGSDISPRKEGLLRGKRPRQDNLLSRQRIGSVPHCKPLDDALVFVSLPYLIHVWVLHDFLGDGAHEVRRHVLKLLVVLSWATRVETTSNARSNRDDHVVDRELYVL